MYTGYTLCLLRVNNSAAAAVSTKVRCALQSHAGHAAPHPCLILVWLLATGSMQHPNGRQCVILGSAEQHDAYCTTQVCLK